MDITVDRLPASAWHQLRDLRLEALRDAPSAFWATWEDESTFDAQEWTRFASTIAWFIASRGGRSVGLVGAVQRGHCPDEPEIVGMWVQPAERGKGVAGLLLSSVFAWAEAQDATALTLWVTAGNHRAAELYRRHGFVPTGEEAPMPGGRTGSEVRLRRILAGPAADLLPSYEVVLNRVPPHLRELAAAARDRAVRDPRVAGLVVGGSVARGTADQYSDLDLVIVCEDETYPEVLATAHELAESLGPLLVAFTGEHVGEPRLLVALYDAGPRHVDLKFVSVRDLGTRVEDGLVVWQRDRVVDRAHEQQTASWPSPDPQWIEDRFWVWAHYTTVKCARGELFEAVDALSLIRSTALAPLIMADRIPNPSGVRRLEQAAPAWVPLLRRTVPDVALQDCLRATKATIDVYLRLRDPGRVEPRAAAERAARDYFDAVDTRSRGL